MDFFLWFGRLLNRDRCVMLLIRLDIDICCMMLLGVFVICLS